MRIFDRLLRYPPERSSERVSAASYGTVLVLAALPLVTPEQVSSGWGWELVTGVGLATWVAHLYAEVLGNHIRTGAVLDRAELASAMADGVPILLAAVAPASVLGLGRLQVLDPRVAMWATVVVAFVQLLGLAVFVGRVVPHRGALAWTYAAGTAAVGVLVVAMKLFLRH